LEAAVGGVPWVLSGCSWRRAARGAASLAADTGALAAFLAAFLTTLGVAERAFLVEGGLASSGLRFVAAFGLFHADSEGIGASFGPAVLEQ